MGVFTNEPTFDWHQKNIEHYEWKRTLARQAVAVPGNFYPEERFLRAYMVKSGMQDMGLMGECVAHCTVLCLCMHVWYFAWYFVWVLYAGLRIHLLKQ